MMNMLDAPFMKVKYEAAWLMKKFNSRTKPLASVLLVLVLAQVGCAKVPVAPTQNTAPAVASEAATPETTVSENIPQAVLPVKKVAAAEPPVMSATANIKKPDAEKWPLLASDGYHDPSNPLLKRKQEPREGMAGLPENDYGNHVNWVTARQTGAINPRRNKTSTPDEVEVEVPVMDMDIYLDINGSMPIVRFPHLAHTIWLHCENCHELPAPKEKIFIPQQGANNIRMEGILSGEQCGICHSAVAFPLSNCFRCHSVSRSSAEGMSAMERARLRGVQQVKPVTQPPHSLLPPAAELLQTKIAVLEVGEKTELRNVLFETGKAILLPQSKVELDKLVAYMNSVNTLAIEIGGHTDNSGKASSNQTLSLSRAKAVVMYLVRKGIAATRLTYKGYGSSQAVDDNKTAAGRAKNRRVEVMVVSK